MRGLLSLGIFLFLHLAWSQDAGLALQLNLNQTHELSVTEDASVYEITTTGSDPYIVSLPLTQGLEANQNQLAFEYFCPTGIDVLQVYTYPINPGEEPVTLRDIGSTEGWVPIRIDLTEKISNWGKKGDSLRIDFGTAPGLTIQIRNLQIRAQSEREKAIEAEKQAKKQQELQLQAAIESYLNTSYEGQITQVLAKEEVIEITGTISGKAKVLLAEIPLHEHVTDFKTAHFTKIIRPNNGIFKAEIPRYHKVAGALQDRLLSRWILVEPTTANPLSHARYTDSVVPQYTYDYLKPKTIKGLGGYSADRQAPSSDLEDLGINSVTVNIWINGLFRSQASAENVPFEYLGKTYYVNKEQLDKYDRTMQKAFALDIEVSAILLVAKASQSPDKKIGEALQHPDCDPAGIYAMPDVTSAQGITYYSAINDFLAQRYSRPDGKFGRIHHYIIHNEVDAGWVWTNAGDKTKTVFMDLYHKSMRLTYLIARKYNPNAQVFISLTHYWNWTSNNMFYHSKDLLNLLVSYSDAEGNFEWAIAQHPYPESLREPKTWLDKKVSFDFNTQLITFKNIEVLAAWAKRPEMLYKGKTRIIYLSENGTNSPTYSSQDLDEQAAGMAYALKKIKYLDAIKGFQYHNWQDNRREGGLRIGLRRFPDDEEQPGAKKPVWFVYQAFGTNQEDAVFDPYKKLIGIENWNEIRYEKPITE
ncbi:DUF5722 domain-containing protein [Leeuwenhoekiella parthenopeia]|uniref:DUF5722 domain-containing protein n=1 Tax=Leeuwenhoekiella parthenopeia TaxID=2890320 RepID=A0ABS8GNG2_9FLAO|nr:DUF5722 domain-containing protein [Leeuwenhoekiella parthenopeia]MCC4211527.1 DUF5722 domain-containing protein [Leeuwenhoekiella parthenopeia]